jgi:hypothetical protein
MGNGKWASLLRRSSFGCEGWMGNALALLLAVTAVGCQLGRQGNSPAVAARPAKARASQPAVPTKMIHASANGYVTAHHPEWRQKLTEPMKVVDKQSRWQVRFGQPGQKQLVLEMEKDSYKILRSSMQP